MSNLFAVAQVSSFSKWLSDIWVGLQAKRVRRPGNCLERNRPTSRPTCAPRNLASKRSLIR